MKNLDEILAMAQNVQSELQKAQDQLDTIEVEGVSGGGLVKVKATAKGRIIGIAIDDSLIEVSEKQMLEDLLAAAFNDARAKADSASGAEMSKMTSGLPLPPGFKLMASTPSCPIAGMADVSRHFYAVQFHPEVTHTVQGRAILERFVLGICGLFARQPNPRLVSNGF